MLTARQLAALKAATAKKETLSFVFLQTPTSEERLEVERRTQAVRAAAKRTSS